eukprot:XP_011667069.1 PREDICTED: uncharacterized protein LOC105439595 [Strongylocentrotus purpuratus]
MASELSSLEGVCEGGDCTANADLTFYVKEKKKLCHDCASKKECFGKARQGGPNLYCEKHGKDIDLYCKTHGVALCISCVVIDHHEKPCVRQDIDDAIMENKAKLNILKKEAMKKLKLCRAHGKHIGQCRQAADEHLQSIKDEVDSVIEKAIARDKVREQEDAAKIDQEIDGKNQKLQEDIQKMQDKIRKNNEERKKRHDENNTNAENRQQPINNKHRDLQADILNIDQEIKRKIGELEKSWQDDTKATENASQTIETVLEDDPDPDGMIIAAEERQSHVYVINLCDGKIINTITCKENIRLRDMLSSGHIIARPWPEDRRALIIDRDGGQREIPHNDVILNICVDHKTDDLYVVTSDDEYKTCVIDLVQIEGDMKKRRVASFPLSTRAAKGFDLRNHLLMSRVIMTSSGKMIACDRDNIFVFKQLFSL